MWNEVGNWPASTGRAALEAVAPEAATAFDRLCNRSPLDAGATAAIRNACAGVLRIAPLGGPSGMAVSDAAGPDVAASDGFGAMVAMAEQFSVDVSSVDDRMRNRLFAACGDDAFAVVLTVYVADMAPRVRAVLDRLFAASDESVADDPGPVEPAEMWAAIEDFLRVVHRLDRLDPVMSELVRLRGARQHDCRLCKSLRSRPALAAGATEATFDAIDDGPSGLSAPQRTAIALTDAIIWQPGDLADELVDDVRRHFAPDQAVELVLDVMRNAANKIAVAFGADDPHVTEGVEIYEIDHDGVAHYGLVAP